MKTRYSCIFGIMAMLMLVSSFVIPGKLVNPTPVSADPGLMEWTIVDTMDSTPGTGSVYSPVPPLGMYEYGSEFIKLVVGNNNNTMWAIVRIGYSGSGATCAKDSDNGNIVALRSTNGGQTWSATPFGNLKSAMALTAPQITTAWDVAIAPDNPNLVALAVSRKPTLTTYSYALEVWISEDGGTTWQNTQWPPAGATGFTASINYFISDMQISMDYGGARDLMIGTRGTPASTKNVQIMKIPSYGGWRCQDLAGSTSTEQWAGDVLALRFSPTYVGDATLAVVTANATGTYLVTGAHDLSQNRTDWQPNGSWVEVKDGTSPAGASPNAATIINADLELPSDFSGQSTSLRRFYISTDALTGAGLAAAGKDVGVFRVDDNIVYTLMDNTNTSFGIGNVVTRRAHSIAYWGTYASGKLLVGETLGQACKAAVPTWFTDSPTVCPVPCWYPAKKPVSGAAGQLDCTQNTQYYGNAYVVWSPTYADQGVAYAVTGAAAWGPWAATEAMDDYPDLAVPESPFAVVEIATPAFPVGLLNTAALDESAFALTRNNGETWNELSAIDTRIAKLTDVMPSADCTTVYLASVSNGTLCTGFDSVWRSTTNEKVVAPPLPALPIGSIWERVRVSPTAVKCTDNQAEHAILRLAPDKQDGQVVFWAAGGIDGNAQVAATNDMHINTYTTNMTTGYKHLTFTVRANTQAVAWSPDYGDFWADINPRIAVEDMAAESSTALYLLDTRGNVQKMPYSGTAWSSTVQTVNYSTGGHTIEATGLGRVIIGKATGAAVSTDGGKTARGFTRVISGDYGTLHAIFDTDFETNATAYFASDYRTSPYNDHNADEGKIYRNKFPAGSGAEFEDMVTGFTSHREFYGIVQSNSKNVSGQGTLYAAHAAKVWTDGIYGGVERTLRPLDGIPKPGITWDCLDASLFYRGQASVIEFTLEPKSLKICGCLTQDTNSTLYAIDNAWYASNHMVNLRSTDIPAPIACAERGRYVRWSGMLWAYTDCVAKVGPKLTMDDNTIIGCDPATGRNQEVNFTWEQLCIANTYELAVAKDKAFALKIFGGVFSPASVTSPALVYLSGGEGTYPELYTDTAASDGTHTMFKATVPSLECGHTYYWKVRVRNETTNDWVRSPWSDVRGFTIKAGFKVTTPYYGPQLLAPDNGCGCACDAPLCFSWSPFKETVEYKFELSKNADMSSPLVSTTTKGTAYQYTGKADCNTNYFWRVQATKPAPSEWSATYSFMTQKAPPPAPTPEPPPETPMWVWVVIAIGTILVIVTLVLIFKTRRV